MVGVEFTRGELQASYLASLLEDGDRLFVGANLPVPRAAALLAHLTHAPGMKLALGLVNTNVAQAERLEPTRFSTDYRVSRWAEGVVIHNDIFDRPEQVADIFFAGGIQVDRYGNTNLIGLRGDDGRMTLRGPGSLGTTSMCHYARRYFIYSTRHDTATFVPKVDYVSTFGYGDGGDHRARLGLDRYNPGPEAVVTPLAVLDFETPDHRMRLRSVHPGVTVEEVVAATGFELVVGDGVGETPGPSEEALRLLRDRIDVEGLLRRP